VYYFLVTDANEEGNVEARPPPSKNFRALGSILDRLSQFRGMIPILIRRRNIEVALHSEASYTRVFAINFVNYFTTLAS
jgi:hypothetical protein